MHLVFYDGECGLCDHAVIFLLKQDKRKEFLFAPLQGKTAKKVLGKLPEEDTLILVESFGREKQQVLLFGKAAFRIAWLLGGKWAFFGWVSFLPSILYDWGYRLVARNRHRLFQKVCRLPDPKEKMRFLD